MIYWYFSNPYYFAVIAIAAYHSIRFSHLVRILIASAVLLVCSTLHAQNECATTGINNLQVIRTTRDANNVVHQTLCFNPVDGSEIKPYINTFSGILGIYNHNGIFWAGSQATPSTPTITASEASGIGTGVCRFEVAPLYNAAESTNLVTNSMGYRVYEPTAKCFGYDNRQNVTFGTAPMYSELVMGYNAGELTAVGINLWAQTFGNPIPDSTTAGSNFLWVGAPVTATKMPAAGGDQIALAGVVSTTDKVDNNGSPSAIVGVDGEANLNNTTMTGTFTGAFGGAFGAHITRAASTAHVAIAGAIHAFGFGNTSSSGGGADKIYTILVEQPGASLGGETAAIYTHGNILFDQNGSIYAHTSGTTGGPTEQLRFIGNALGLGASTFNLCSPLANCGLGFNSNPHGYLYLGIAATNNYFFNPITPAALRQININDPGRNAGLVFSSTNTADTQYMTCGTTSTCAKTNQTTWITVNGGPVSLVAGALTITSLPFTSSTSYICSPDDSTGINGIDVVYVSGSSVTFNGTGTDSIRYQCSGN
jgi:hypothetical protein